MTPGARANGYRLRRGQPRGRLSTGQIARTGGDVADASFDIVSKVDKQELDNAVNQAEKELGTRFDFRGVNASVKQSGEEAITLQADTEERALAALEVFKEKLVKRGISLK